MAGVVEGMFKRFTARQSRFFEKLSSDAKKKLDGVENKYGQLEVTGPEGGTFYFQYKGKRLHMLDKPPDVDYEDLDRFGLDGDMINYFSGDEVLFDVIDGSLPPRAVISRGYFTVYTDKIIYDREEFASAFERFLDEMRMVLGVKGE